MLRLRAIWCNGDGCGLDAGSRRPNERILDWLKQQIAKTTVDVRLKTRATIETLKGLKVDEVVVATGAFNTPRLPSFARELDESIVQLHSKEYRRRSQIQKGTVLVVGAGNSGAEIAMELACHHQTWLSGPDTGQEPARAGSRLDHLVTPLMWFVATRLTVKTALGRKLRDHFIDPPRGIPLGRVRRKDFAPAGIERVPRMTAVMNGYPVMENGRVLEVSNVIWCTGYAPHYDWIDLSLRTHNGLPIHDRGIVESCPGLYFVGLLFLYSLSSALLGGVGRDAKHIVDHIVSTRPARMGVAGESPQRR